MSNAEPKVSMSDNHEGVLKASRLFSSIDAELVSTLARTASRTRYARGEYLWHVGGRTTHFAVVASGLVKISRCTADGSETIIALFGPRESIGDVAVLGGRPYPADAVALTDVDLVRVDAMMVRGAFASNPTLLAAMNTSVIEHTRALLEKISIVSAGKIEKRLATLLLHLATRFGDDNGDGTTFVPIRISRSECARLIGATIETTIRTFSRWQKAALVETTDEGFTLRDVGVLRELTRN